MAVSAAAKSVVAGFGNPNSSTMLPSRLRKGWKRQMTHSTPKRLKSRCARAVRFALTLATDAAMLEVVTMVYGGLVNKNLVAQLQANGVNALGLTGADADAIRSHKRPLKDGVDYGFVGDVDAGNGEMLSKLIEAGITPVMAPLTHDGKGQILNTNADTIASETAKALANIYDVTLIFSFEKKGVLRNPDDDDSVIPVITHEDFERYKADGTISGGMLPKIENALNAVEAGVSRVIITLATAIDGQHGTVIQ